MTTSRIISRVIGAFACLAPFALSAQPHDIALRIDKIFANLDRNAPGCAVALGKDGRALYTHAYGSANLEYGIPLTDSSVMESGSVAKQFTAAAMVLLSQDGKLALDDDIRKYLPEVPDFGKTITIRNLLTHTSGLRDHWGLLGIEGRGPGTQVHSPHTTLDLVAHQKMLNFPPGSAYLYSNTGYALAALIIERVSGKTLQEFTQDRLFVPLGMTHTLWRDDFTRVIPNRATAYSMQAGTFHTDMPFTNMVGNGGILSTMADLLKWNENFDNTTVGGATFTPTLQTQMRLTNGRTVTYALGLEHLVYDGVNEIGHGGSTAGYRTFLARYPDQHVSVAVWCNNASINPTVLAHQVADVVLVKPPHTQAASILPAIHQTRAELSQWAGVYRDVMTDQITTLVANDSALTGGATQVFIPIGPQQFRTPTGQVQFSREGRLRTFILARANGDTAHFEEVKLSPRTVPTADYVGRYVSDELDAVLNVIARDDSLFITRRPDSDIALRPTYADAFQGSGGLNSIQFNRDAKGVVTGFSIFAGRVLDVRFKRLK
ncbi:MAG: beta-lactamase family protein [Gemmatimonadota bacterium]|nr:beta-lactamase family protein [Gemmatimonadota bacterium]